MGVFVVQLGEGSLAVLAAKGSFARMRLYVNSEHIGVGKGLAAVLALVRPFVGVDSEMYNR